MSTRFRIGMTGSAGAAHEAEYRNNKALAAGNDSLKKLSAARAKARMAAAATNRERPAGGGKPSANNPKAQSAVDAANSRTESEKNTQTGPRGGKYVTTRGGSRVYLKGK